jgi:hypothetical protein
MNIRIPRKDSNRLSPEGEASIREQLVRYIDAGIPLCPFRRDPNDGKYKPVLRGEAYQDRRRWIHTKKQVEQALAMGIHNFKFVPGEAGLICLDVDMKGDYNGIKALGQYCNERTIDWMLGSLHVNTPSLGYHFYFKYSGDEWFVNDLKNGLEVKYGKLSLTTAGSAKMMHDGRLVYYNFTADGFDFPAFPEYSKLGMAVLKHGDKQRAARRDAIAECHKRCKLDVSRVQRDESARITNYPSLNTLADECTGLGHHNALVRFAGAAKRCGYDVQDAVSVARNRSDIFGHHDIEYTIKHCYNTFRGKR